jgi:hypothetical protein
MSTSDETRKEQAKQLAERRQKRRETILREMRRDVRLFEQIVRGRKDGKGR